MGATATSQLTAAPAAIRNILFTTDFSPCSQAALPIAVTLAKNLGAAIFVAHILPGEPRLEVPLDSPRELDPVKRKAEQQFEALLRSGVFDNVVQEPILRNGALWENLEEIIGSRGIDMIVCGTHGRQGLRKLLFGSTAEVIFRRAQCPVLTIGPHV